ncbi:MAG: multicopper oxidase domain-containing protein [Saprospiraceae bacterium]
MKTFFSVCRLMLQLVLLLFAFTAYAQPNFTNKIPIPYIIDAKNGVIPLEIRMTHHKFNPGNTSPDILNGGPTQQPLGIPTYAYNHKDSTSLTILGPTLRWYTDSITKITVKNMLGVPTTTHWHGAELPPESDGGPHQGILAGTTWSVPQFAVEDSACTMWYHPHFHDITVQQVTRGLSGMIIVEQASDPIRPTLPRTYGVDDIPVIIGDFGFTSGSSNTNGYFIDTIQQGQDQKHPFNLVNGVTNPYVEVPAHMVRLRILNGSSRKGAMYGLSKGYNDPLPLLLPFHHIATDGGYTQKPVLMKSFLNGPGIRDEIVLNLEGMPVNSKLYLRNLKQLMNGSIVGSPFKPWQGAGGRDSTNGNAFLELRIVADSQFPGYVPVTTIPSLPTVWSPGLADSSSSTIKRYRTKELVQIPGGGGFHIDDTTYVMHLINDTICVGTKEIWTIHNKTKVAHPFHIHKIQFRILEARDSLGVKRDLDSLGWNGPKDNVLVFPGWRVRFLGQYDDYPRPIDSHFAYMYHCHILTHEDVGGGGMMHQFVVTNEGPCAGSGVDTEADGPIMTLFPNPSTGVLNMKGESARSHNSTLSILDLQGRLIREQNLHHFHGEASIDIDGLSNGMYLVTWKTGMGTVTGKLVIQRQ